MQVHIRRAPLPYDERASAPAAAASSELAHQYGLTRLRLSAIAQPSPIYDSFAGVISPRRAAARTGPNPIYEERALDGAVSRLRMAARMASPRKKEKKDAYTLAAEEQLKAEKVAEEEALDRRRQGIVTQIYGLMPTHKSLLQQSRKKEKEIIVPPAPRWLAAAKLAQQESAAWGCPADPIFRPKSAPSVRHARSSGYGATTPSSPRPSTAKPGGASPSCSSSYGGAVEAVFSSSPSSPSSPRGQHYPPTPPSGGRPSTSPPRSSRPARPSSAAPGYAIPASRRSPPRFTPVASGTATRLYASRPPTAPAGMSRRALAASPAAGFSGWHPPGGAPAPSAIHAPAPAHRAAPVPAPAAPAAPVPAALAPAAAPAEEADSGFALAALAPAAAEEKEQPGGVAAGAPAGACLQRAPTHAACMPADAATRHERAKKQRRAKVAVELKKATTALSQTDLLADLGEIQLAMMAAAGKRRKHTRYSSLYREGSLATSFYILTGGVLRESSVGGGANRELRVDRKAGGSSSGFVLFGMESLLGRPRASTIDVMEDADVIKFTAVDLNIQQDGAVKVARKVFNAFVEGELCHMALFNGVAPRVLKQVVPLFSLEEIESGGTIFTAGGPGDKVYILMHGSVGIWKGKLLLNTLSAEQGTSSATEMGLPVFGEMAMIDRRPRAAMATAQTDVKLLVLPYDQFAACMMILPDMKSRLRRLTELRKTQNAVNEKRLAQGLELAAGARIPG